MKKKVLKLTLKRKWYDGNAQRADHSPINGFEYKTPQGCAKEAVSLADALINELQKKGASNENN